MKKVRTLDEKALFKNNLKTRKLLRYSRKTKKS